MDIATNNEAEYTGLIIGLEKAIEQGIQELEVYGDSNLVVNQVNGFWRIKQSHLRPLAFPSIIPDGTVQPNYAQLGSTGTESTG